MSLSSGHLTMMEILGLDNLALYQACQIVLLNSCVHVLA